MNSAKTAILSLCLPLALNALALDVTSEAGNLGSTLGQDNLSSTTLSITGTIDASDFDFISKNLKELKELDLSNATITSYSGKGVLSGATDYADNELPAYSLMGLPLESVTLPASLRIIGEGALAATAIAEIALPEELDSIGRYAFAACRNLKNAVIPASVNRMGDAVFADCTSLESASLGTLPSVATRTFDGCAALTEVTLSPAATEISEAAFRSTKSLASIAMPPSLKKIGDAAFYQSALVSLDLAHCPEIDSIGNFAFAKCPNLAEAAFGKAVKLGQGVFFDDAALAVFTLPQSLETIPEFTFKGNSAINPEAVLAPGVVEIRDYALTGWTHVEELSLPETIEYIGDNAMEGWTSLTSLDAGDVRTVPQLGSDVWDQVEQAEATLLVHPDDVDAYTAADQWNKFKIQAKILDKVDNITAASNNGIEVAYRDGVILITSKGEKIANVIVYDLDGRRRLAKSVGAQSVEIPTRDWASVVVAAKVTLANGAHSSFKLQVTK